MSSQAAERSGLSAWSSKLIEAFTSSQATKTFFRIFSYSTARDRVFICSAVITSICAGGTLPIMNIIFAQLVKSFQVLAVTPQKDLSRTYMHIVNRYVLYMIYLFIGRLLLAYIAILGFRTSSLRISAAVRLAYMRSLFKQPISNLDLIPPGGTAAIITVTANTLQLGISERLSNLIQAISILLTSFMIGCWYSWQLTLVISSGLCVIVVFYAITTPILVKSYEKVQSAERASSGVASDVLSSMRIVAACGAEDTMASSFNKQVDDAEAAGHKMSPILALQHSPVFFIIYASFALCFWFAVREYLALKFRSIDVLVVVLMSAMTMISNISAVSVPLNAASNAINAMAIFLTIIDAPEPDTSGASGGQVDMGADITLQDINFAYPQRPDIKVLAEVNLSFPMSRTTAIVGPSGSGKSTLVALLQRWYDLDANDDIVSYFRNGHIKIGDKDISHINLTWWRSQIGLVQQEPFLFNDTIFRNVAYGLAGTEWENAEHDVKFKLVEEACREAYADEFIARLPQGYDTEVGDIGIKFSGGQRQRIAIARSIVRKPRILIFDEATSALDVTSERIVQAALHKVSQNRTTIVIAHRLSTIKDADNIVFLSNGKVLQQGTHESLLADEGGPYWKLVNAQQLMFDSKTILRPSTATLMSNYPEVEKLFEDDIWSHAVPDEKTGVENIVELVRPSVDAEEAQPSNASQSRGFFRSFGMLMLEQKSNWVGYLIMFISSAGAASSYAVQAYLFADLFTLFSYWGDWVRDMTIFLCKMLLVVACGVFASYFALGWASNTVSVRTIARYRKEYFRNVISERISFFDHDENAVGILVARIATDPSQLQQLLGINMALVCISVLNVIGCMTIAFYFGWKFSLVITCGSMPIILISAYYRVRFELRFEERNNKVFSESANFATEAIKAMRTVASLTLEDTISRRYESLLKGHIIKSFQEARFSALIFAASDSLSLLCMAFALWYGGTLIAAGEYYTYQFLVIYLAVIQGSMAAGQWLSFGPNIAQVTTAANRIYNMRIKHSNDDSTLPASSSLASRDPSGYSTRGAAISFQSIGFTYPTRPIPVLQNLNLEIEPGQFAAIVGASGSGKTTVVSLLERFYEPNTGSILYNGQDISSISLHTYRKQLSLVAQEPYLFRGSIRDNVLLGVDRDSISEEQLHQACRDAGIHDFVISLPNEYATDVGTSGVALSGGQKQRISIARALIRNPDVLLLDEATSSLDSETEKEVQAVFERTSRGRTMVVVAHRLATVQNADIIFVMREGRVVEKGSHLELLKQMGWYWQMCEAQSLSV